MANSYTLPTGRVIPTETAEHVRAGIREAIGTHGTAAATDDKNFRQHLISRAAHHGMRHMIPASWGRESAGKSAMPGTVMIKMLGNGRVGIEGVGTADRQALAKSRFALPWERSSQLQETDAGRAFVKSQQYADLAAKAFDRETREMWLDAARELRKEAGLS